MIKNKLTIRKVSYEDIDGLHICNKNNLPVFYTQNQFLYFLLDKNYDIIIAIINDKIIGYVLGEYKKKNIFHIMSIAVNEDYRKMKIGTRMINYCCENINNVCSKITLYVHIENKSAIN